MGRVGTLRVRGLFALIKGQRPQQDSSLRSRLAVLLQHLLKWRFQPSHRTPSWKRTIRTQRREIESLLDESPSLKRHIETLYPKAYEDARNDAADETGLPLDTFPETNPWSYDDAMTEVVT